MANMKRERLSVVSVEAHAGDRATYHLVFPEAVDFVLTKVVRYCNITPITPIPNLRQSILLWLRSKTKTNTNTVANLCALVVLGTISSFLVLCSGGW